MSPDTARPMKTQRPCHTVRRESPELMTSWVAWPTDGRYRTIGHGRKGGRSYWAVVTAHRCMHRTLADPLGGNMSIDDLWYKNAVIYCLDVEKYQDANGDGIGDFEGLMRRLDYLQGLGVTCVWLQPFYTSPNRDNGYDISDYYSVHDEAWLARRLRGVHEPRRRDGHPGDRRPGGQPHIDGDSLVPAGPRATGSRSTATGTYGPTNGRRTTRRASSFPGEQKTTWTLDRRPRGSTTSTDSTSISPT